MGLRTAMNDILPAFEITTSTLRDTVWVNGPDGSCLARFSKRYGIDVHTSAEAQLAGAEQCLFCTHAPAGPEEWQVFREQVHRHHAIEIPENILSF